MMEQTKFSERWKRISLLYNFFRKMFDTLAYCQSIHENSALCFYIIHLSGFLLSWLHFTLTFMLLCRHLSIVLVMNTAPISKSKYCEDFLYIVYSSSSMIFYWERTKKLRKILKKKSWTVKGSSFTRVSKIIYNSGGLKAQWFDYQTAWNPIK